MRPQHHFAGRAGALTLACAVGVAALFATGCRSQKADPPPPVTAPPAPAPAEASPKWETDEAGQAVGVDKAQNDRIAEAWKVAPKLERPKIDVKAAKKLGEMARASRQGTPKLAPLPTASTPPAAPAAAEATADDAEAGDAKVGDAKVGDAKGKAGEAKAGEANPGEAQAGEAKAQAEDEGADDAAE